jgi:hypothetical protein
MATKISQLPAMTTAEDVMQIPYITTGSASLQTKRMSGLLLKTAIIAEIDNFTYDGGNASSTYLDPDSLASVGGLGA